MDKPGDGDVMVLWENAPDPVFQIGDIAYHIGDRKFAYITGVMFYEWPDLGGGEWRYQSNDLNAKRWDNQTSWLSPMQGAEIRVKELKAERSRVDQEIWFWEEVIKKQDWFAVTEVRV